MSTSGQIGRVTKMLAATSFGLFLIVVLLLAFPAQLPDVESEGQQPAELPEVTAPPPFVPATFDSYTSILERPLLYASRRLPAPPPVEAAPEVPKEPLRLKLEGVAMGGGARVALLRDETSRELLHIAEGMSHNGWTLESVQADKAVFRRDNQVTELALEIQTGRRR